ncbi:MAG TPA: TfoX/Sxy family protein [Rhizomicrobium sp.]|jgi:DNA transformation protein|nr:TfoX/Sxy family protein [Rhizomicrobium sp.]
MNDPHRFDDLFSEFGPITVKRFFGGEGIYAGGIMIGAVFDDILYFTTNAETRGAFLAEKCKPFTFEKRSKGEMIETHWYAMPERLYDDPEELAQWARIALNVAADSSTTKKKRAKRAKALVPARSKMKR